MEVEEQSEVKIIKLTSGTKLGKWPEINENSIRAIGNPAGTTTTRKTNLKEGEYSSNLDSKKRSKYKIDTTMLGYIGNHLTLAHSILENVFFDENEINELYESTKS